MHRCLQLAALGRGSVAPNPMVGAVLVHEGKIIGEGYHKQYGGPHAEVECIASVKKEDHPLIHRSTLYVSLEPCAHFGKTPPCTDLIIANKIPAVVIGCRDPFHQVAGKGIFKLKEAGVEVTVGILEDESLRLNRRFFTYHTLHRPYVILKWAQTGDGRIAGEGGSRLRISNEATNRLVHQWRSEEMAILVGTNTALNDDPELTTRLWPGKNPVRLVVDMDLRLPQDLKLFLSGPPTIVFNLREHRFPEGGLANLENDKVYYYQVTADVSLVQQVLHGLYHTGVQSVIVEGGAHLLQSFIEEDAWDEARIITNEEMHIGSGLPAPQLGARLPQATQKVFSDVIRTYQNK